MSFTNTQQHIILLLSNKEFIMEFIRAKNYTDFANNWSKEIPCYYTGWKSLKCDGKTIFLERPNRNLNLLLAEKVGDDFILYNHRNKDYATDLMKYWSYSQRSYPNLKYVTLGKPKGYDNSWLSNQLYESLMRVTTHLLHPDQSLEDLREEGS
tara:strand:- start:546 stop:1004 length:459 start_codon:yes stop_codon:yes gene_type:complete